MNHITQDLSDIFVERFLERDTAESHRVDTLLKSAESQSQWTHIRHAEEIFRASIRKRFGEGAVFQHRHNFMATVRLNSCFDRAVEWGLRHNKSVMYWPGDVIDQPESVMPQPTPETKRPTEDELMRLRMLTMHTQSMGLLRDGIGRAANAMQVVREALVDIRCAAAGEIGKHAAELKALQELVDEAKRHD